MSSGAPTFAVGKPHITALFDDGHFHFAAHDKRAVSELGSVELPKSPARRLDTQSEVLIRQIADSNLPIVLRLGEDMGLVFNQTFPEAARHELRSIVAHQLDGMTPWPPDRVMYDALVKDGTADGQIDVEIVAAPKEHVEAATSALGSLGLTASAIDMVVDFPNAPCVHNLLGGTQPPQTAKVALTATAIATSLVIAAGLSLYLYIDDNRSVLAERMDLADGLSERLADLPDLHRQLEGLSEQTQRIAERRREQPSALLVLDGLSRALPDGVWLDRLTIDGSMLRLSGYAPDAEDLLSLVESDEGFANAQFATANRQELVDVEDGQITAESFTLEAEILMSGTRLPTPSDAPEP